MVSEIQSVIFRKEHWTESKAKAWLRHNHFKVKLESTRNTFRARQRPPGKYKRIRIKKIDTGLMLSIGFT